MRAAVFLGLVLLAAAGCASGGRRAAPLAPAAPAPSVAGFEDSLARYRRAVAYVCWRGLTPELQRLWEDAVRALDAAQYGGGRGGDFAGVTRPEHAWADCGDARSLRRRLAR